MSVLRWFGRAASVVTAVLALGVFAACGGDESTSRSASADIKVMLGQALSADDVARIRVEVQGPGISTALGMDLVRDGATWNGTLENIPVGADRVFTATAYDSASTALYWGQAGPMAIQADRVAAVFLLLQQANFPPPFENEAPIIDSLTVSTNEVEPGGSITLTAAAHDNNPGDTLTYAWSAPGGTFSAPAAASTSWTAPATEGVQRIQLEVRDSKNAAATITVDLTVRNVGLSGRAAVTVRVNTWPEVSAMMGAPSVLSVGRTTLLAASVSDPDGDTVGFFWASSCEGTFDDFDSRTPTFTLSAAPPDARCIFTVYASDTLGGYHVGNLTLQVGSGPQVNMQRVPVVDSVSQSAQRAFVGELVTLGLTAHDPEGTALSVSWVASQGILLATRGSGGSASADWLAPACFDSPAEVTAIITDASGAATDVTFTVLPWPGPSCGAQTVLGRSSTYFVQDDGSVVSRPTDLSVTLIIAWVPTAEGSYTEHYGQGLRDGTFVIHDVESTPYLLQFGSTYYWTHGRTPDLSSPLPGRADLEPEPDDTLFNLNLDGLNPWDSEDDLQVSAFGAGLSYFARECASPPLEPVVGSTVFTGSTGYDASLFNCGNRVGRIDLARGDTVHVAQLTTRPSTVGGLDVVREARRGFQISSGSPGGSVVSGGGAVTLTGTLAPQPTSSRTVQINASEFEALLLAAHPRATLRNTHDMSVGALPQFMRFGTYAGWFDLARGSLFTPGQPLVTQELEVSDPFPASWTRFASNVAAGSMSYSVPLAGGGNSVPASFRFTVYTHGPFQDGSALLSPQVGPPRNLRLNGQDATVDGLQGLGESPLVTWDAPVLGVPTSYMVRLYRLSVSGTNGTLRSLMRSFITTDPQLRLPPGLLIPGRHYHLQVQANRRVGGDVSSPNLDAPWSSNAPAFTGRFQP
ncbi:fibronectin type III domain-containing protein [Pyxidicoccus trucidator]|uniref:fibronectin type III domain-containing protein n=1 Tax=Pyxidicoccus trucidator TaxID=2709662 RepID=UPI0013DB324D|nr:fibronectin type III domain-containing protein [Pyxidicoccus trucidator]